MKKACIIYFIFLGLALALYGAYCCSYNPRERWEKALIGEEMNSIGLPDTIRTEEFVNLWNTSKCDNYTSVIYFEKCLHDSTIDKLNELVAISNRYDDGYDNWQKSCDTIQLQPDNHITDNIEWVKSKKVLYHHFLGGLDSSVTYWIYEDRMIADAESSKFPYRIADFLFAILFFALLLIGLSLALVFCIDKWYERRPKVNEPKTKHIVVKIKSNNHL